MKNNSVTRLNTIDKDIDKPINNICKYIYKSPSEGPLFCCNKCFKNKIFEYFGTYCIVDEKYIRRGILHTKTINKTAKNKGNVRLFDYKKNNFERECIDRIGCKENRLVYDYNIICLLSI